MNDEQIGRVTSLFANPSARYFAPSSLNSFKARFSVARVYMKKSCINR